MNARSPWAIGLSIDEPIETSAINTGLLMDRDGLWLRTPDDVLVRFDRHPVLQRLLTALAEKRREEPGVAMSQEELLEACWPDENLDYRSARNRLFAHVSRLRRRGLAHCLQTYQTGYRLDPRVPIRIV